GSWSIEVYLTIAAAGLTIRLRIRERRFIKDAARPNSDAGSRSSAAKGFDGRTAIVLSPTGGVARSALFDLRNTNATTIVRTTTKAQVPMIATVGKPVRFLDRRAALIRRT